MEILSRGKPKAIKQHVCDFCYGSINKGETYNNVTYKDGEIYTWKSHLCCEELISLLDMDDNYDGITHDLFNEYIVDYADCEKIEYQNKSADWFPILAKKVYEHIKNKGEK